MYGPACRRSCLSTRSDLRVVAIGRPQRTLVGRRSRRARARAGTLWVNTPACLSWARAARETTVCHTVVGLHYRLVARGLGTLWANIQAATACPCLARVARALPLDVGASAARCPRDRTWHLYIYI
jgi:hypothetical protein